jgi:hypothetical protein
MARMWSLLLFAIVMLVAPMALADQPPRSPATVAPAAGPDTRCCRTCSRGKACGDGCISQERQCKKGQGCACNASSGS